PYLTRVLRVQGQPLHLTDADAAVLHRTAYAEACNGLLEHDIVEAVIRVESCARHPQPEQQGCGRQAKGEGTDQDVVCPGFHSVSPDCSCRARAAARPRGP